MVIHSPILILAIDKGESMSTNIMFKNSPLIKAKDKDKREIYAFQFTGTDENISKIERTVQPLFEEFMAGYQIRNFF
jgi:hypothetical protein